MDKIEVASNFNGKYPFSSILIPVPIYNRVDGHLKRQSYKFSELFNFDFDNKEEVILNFTIISEYENEVKNKEVKINYLPIKVKHAAPIV
ncbi:hypothetical protein [Paenibacillus puerhi]|uniref:hypothetical protein n=1 Tax=Paenibacillus puerhi TaxID=2692622 RepID=UPI00135C10F4|nr:hypothetical protein [Paenibacillus puerhi]